MGDFTGFTFNGVHSGELGITRVIDGDRYKENLFPEIKDLSAEVPGKDGEYFFGHTYGTRKISLTFAYDSITEEQLMDIKKLFGNQRIGSLIFDERPYKKYLVKLETAIELEYICFDNYVYNTETIEDGGIKGRDITYKTTRKTKANGEDLVERVYKGEGTLEFVAYYPFAKSVFKVLPNAVEYKNIDEWKDASRILTETVRNGFDEGHGIDKIFHREYKKTEDLEIVSGKNYYIKDGSDYNLVEEPDLQDISHYYEEDDTYKINVYNGGDMPTSCRIYCPFYHENVTYNYDNLEITYNETKSIVLENVVVSDINPDDIGFLINTENGLIQGVHSIVYDSPLSRNPIITTSTSLYNKYMIAGEFFKLEPNLTPSTESSIIFNGGNESIEVFYDYLYF